MKYLPPVTVAQLPGFDEVIDVRTPAEFAEDHIPGAINCPVLSNEERAEVGTLYKQVSPFEAKKLGAALVARNIAGHLQTVLADRPKSWRPLVYCWRGGQRSGAMTIILQQIGWGARQLEGGYKSYRHHVLAQLEVLPASLHFVVVCGPTGSGKSRFLSALAQTGHQVLDLEDLAAHRGSVLGKLPGQPQPTQKWFDTVLLAQLAGFDPARPVYVEAESKRVGVITLPDGLLNAIRASDCLYMEVPTPERIRFLLEDYDFYLHEPARLIEQLGFLRELHGGRQLEAWGDLIAAGDFDGLVGDLLARHYDPAYFKSMGRNFLRLGAARRLAVGSLAPAALLELAATLP